MAFNPVTRRMTLYPGGPDVWEWDGVAWTRIQPTTRPTVGVFVGQKLVTAPNGSGVLLIGGEDGSLGIWTAGAFYRWDGADWSKVPTTASASAERYHHAVAATPQSVAVHGGVRREEFGFYRTKTTFYWDGIGWTAHALEPEGRDDAHLVYDPARAQLLLVGGSRGFFPQSDPWARSGRAWTRLPAGPNAFGMGVAFDTQRNVLVTFGGCALNLGGPCQSTRDETWEWNGRTWSHLNPPHHPGERTAPAMAYDPVLQQTILFGGTTQALGVQTDTWVWDGLDWTQRTPLSAPPAAGPIAYDPSQSGVVMAAGGQLWRFDGSDWQAGVALPPTFPKLLVYDTRRDRLVLAGNTTYELIAGSWVQRAPIARGSGAGYDPGLGAVVTFGAGGAWEYGPTDLATTTPFGAGCAGPLGIPRLVAPRDPFVGDAWDLQLTNAPTLAWGCIGFDAVTWDNLPLPLELSGFGMPGCTLYQNVARVDPIPAGQWSIAIPAMPTLLGCAVHLQALVITPGLNAAGAVASDALLGVIGGR